MNITILRQCGTRRHDDPIYYLKEKGYVDNITRVLYSIPRHIGEGIVHRTLVKNSLDSLCCVQNLIKMPFQSNQNIIAGVAPYSMLVLYLLKLKKHNNIVYHTSTPQIDRNHWVKKPYLSKQITLWERFLDGTKTVAVTKCAKEAVEQYGAKAYHIPHPVDTNIFSPMSEIEKSKPVKVLFVGYMVESKGVLELLDIAKKSNPKEIEFWFVGKGPLSKIVKELEGKYPVKHFDFISGREELAKVYNQADIYAHPTGEWFGIVLIEAMACGLPVISVEGIGTSEIIEDSIDGFLIPYVNKTLLSDKINILINDEKLRKKMGKKGREKAVSQYDIDVIAKKWWEVIND